MLRRRVHRLRSAHQIPWHATCCWWTLSGLEQADQSAHGGHDLGLGCFVPGWVNGPVIGASLAGIAIHAHVLRLEPHQALEKPNGLRPTNNLEEAQPVVIMDEPQNTEPGDGKRIHKKNGHYHRVADGCSRIVYKCAKSSGHYELELLV